MLEDDQTKTSFTCGPVPPNLGGKVQGTATSILVLTRKLQGGLRRTEHTLRLFNLESFCASLNL